LRARGWPGFHCAACPQRAPTTGPNAYSSLFIQTCRPSAACGLHVMPANGCPRQSRMWETLWRSRGQVRLPDQLHGRQRAKCKAKKSQTSHQLAVVYREASGSSLLEGASPLQKSLRSGQPTGFSRGMSNPDTLLRSVSLVLSSLPGTVPAMLCRCCAIHARCLGNRPHFPGQAG
jgi:hypothetical protein